MPANLIPQYMGLVIQYGLLILFAPCFSFGVVFAFLTQMFKMWTEMQNMTKFWKRNSPSGDYKIDSWLTYMEALSNIAVMTRLFIIYRVFDITDTLGNGTKTYQYTIAIVLIAEHLVITFNYLLSLTVKAKPSWVPLSKALVKLETIEIKKDIEQK